MSGRTTSSEFRAYFQHNVADGTRAKINSFAHLQNGWHYGSGGPIEQRTLSKAQLILTLLVGAGFSRTNAFAGEGCDVLVAGYYGNRYVGVVADHKGYFSVSHEIGGKEILEVDNLSFEEMVRAVTAIREEMWNTFGSYIPTTSTTNAANSMTYASKTTVKAAQSFKFPVLSEAAA